MNGSHGNPIHDYLADPSLRAAITGALVRAVEKERDEWRAGWNNTARRQMTEHLAAAEKVCEAAEQMIAGADALDELRTVAGIAGVRYAVTEWRRTKEGA